MTILRSAVGVAFAAALVACGASPAPPPCACPCPSATVAAAQPSTARWPAIPPPDADASTEPGSAHAMANEYLTAAARSWSKRDGAGCLAALAAHDKLDPRHRSTDPLHAHVGRVRVICLMLSGRCAAGRDLLERMWAAGTYRDPGRSLVEDTDEQIAWWCDGGDATPRDRFLRARRVLIQSSTVSKPDRATCTAAYDTMRSIGPTLKPRDVDDWFVTGWLDGAAVAADCLVRAGDCDGAYAVFREVERERHAGHPSVTDEAILRSSFRSRFARHCPD